MVIKTTLKNLHHSSDHLSLAILLCHWQASTPETANMLPLAIHTMAKHSSLQPLIIPLCGMACHSCNPTNVTAKKPKSLQNQNYCWAHSCCMGKNHTCTTCSSQAPRHVIWVTRANTCRGSMASIDGVNVMAWWLGMGRDYSYSSHYFLLYLPHKINHLTL